MPFLIALLISAGPTFAQHADLGTGTLKNEIWWLNWAGFSISNGASETFTTNDGLQITVTFSNVTNRPPQPTVMSSNYSGSMLWVLYNFSDPTILPSLYDGPEATGTIQYSMSITATRNGVSVPFYLVTADAEASCCGETTSLVTNGSNWQCINLYKNSTQNVDPLTGCGGQSISIHDTYDGQPQSGQSPIIMTQAPTSGPLNLNITYDHGPTTGGMGNAFGILQSEDRGDLPVGYGTAQHQLNYTVNNGCSYPSPFPSMTQDTRLFIGSVPGDADPIQYDNDDSIGVDEEAISSFPAYDGSGSYTLNFPVNNTSGSDAWLSGWFDYNRDGIFQSTEAVLVAIPNNSTSVTLTWTGLPQYLAQGSAADYGFRFRLTSDEQAAQQATGFAKDGEVEDYLVPAQTLCAPVNPAISANQAFCPGQSVPLQSSGGSTYSWSPSSFLSDPNTADPIASPPPSTTSYTVTATTPQGCSGNASVTLTPLPLPTITAGNNATICQNSSTTLQASGGSSYSWTASDHTFQASGPSITVTPMQSTDYYVTGTGTDGCSQTDTISILIHKIPVFGLTPIDTTVCLNSPVTFLASGGIQYAWTTSSGSVLGSDSALSIVAGENSTYEVTISDPICQVSATLSASADTRPLPQLAITSSNNIDCLLSQSTLQVTGANSYQWQSTPGITNLSSSDPIVDPLSTTTYYVRGTDSYGCSSIDSITVNADDSVDLSKYPVPSAFTPNNDGHNDCFGLKYWGHITSLQMNIYNRYGQLVFYTTDPTQCWDGTYHGVPQPAGGYAYQIKANTACGIAYRKGIIILVR